MPVWLYIVMIIICFLAEGFFSGAEIAFVAANKIKLRHLAHQGAPQAKLAQQLLQRPGRLLSTTLVGTNVCTITATALTTALLVRFFGAEASFYCVLIVTPLTLIVGEILPKTVYQHNSNKMVLLLAYPFSFISWLLAPVVAIVNTIAKLPLKLLGVLPQDTEKLVVTKEEIELLLKMEQHGTELEKEERDLIKRIFDFGEATVKETLIPLVEVVAIERNTPIREAIQQVVEHGFSRFPVYYERVDNIIGILNTFDLLYAKEDDTTITDFLRPVYYVPESKRIGPLLKELQVADTQMAVVVDEYGNCSGIVTLEDLLEEVVGEIHDEYETAKLQYQLMADGSYLIDARMEIDQIKEQCGLVLPEGEFETLSGLILEKLGRIPDVGERLRINGLTLTVRKVDGFSIKKVQVSVPKTCEGRGWR